MRASIDLRSEAAELIRLQAFAETFASDSGLADDERGRLLVILEELFTNVITHGYGGQFAAGSILVALGCRSGVLTIDFVDDGPPFDPLVHSEPDLNAPPEQRPVGGLGIAIVRALADRASYRREGHRNHLYLERRLAPAIEDVPPR
jgi:anti-sigma regulatory factor (Ser/Thr protein kinase)